MSLKKVDGVLGSLLARLLPRPGRCEAPCGSMPRLLLIRPGGIGDAVLLIPAICTFKEAFPDSEVTVLAERRNGAVFELCPHVGRVALYDRPGSLLTAMRRRYDLVIDTEQWHRLSAVVARLVRSEWSIGFGTNERQRLFNFAVSYAHGDYEANSFQHLLAPLGLAKQAVRGPFLEVPEAAAMRAATLLSPLRDQPFAALFPGASIPERRWGTERFHRLALWLNDRGLAVVTVGGGQDVEAGEAIVAGCRGLNLAGRTSLVETAALLRCARLLVSGDSGVLHLAVGLDVPTVSLFGPGIAAKWAPRGEKHAVLNKKLPCSPCTRFGTTPPCPQGARCLREISVEEVADAVAVVLSAV